MGIEKPRPLSAQALRVELSGRARQWGSAFEPEVSHSRSASVVYPGDEEVHGNFLHASYRRIKANPDWARRLAKSYTGSRHLPRAGDRWRGELDCATSSDALLMNVFCYPGVLRRREVCALMQVDPGLQPSFGVRAELPMRRGEVDRTELDMAVGATLVEAKLTEGGFGRASQERLLRYPGVEELFSIVELPQANSGLSGYQLIRGILAAVQRNGQYLVLMDARRGDLLEICFRVLGAVTSSAVRQRLRVRTWQELASVLSPIPQKFLREKYGIEAT